MYMHALHSPLSVAVNNRRLMPQKNAFVSITPVRRKGHRSFYNNSSPPFLSPKHEKNKTNAPLPRSLSPVRSCVCINKFRVWVLLSIVCTSDSLFGTSNAVTVPFPQESSQAVKITCRRHVSCLCCIVCRSE